MMIIKLWGGIGVKKVSEGVRVLILIVWLCRKHREPLNIFEVYI